jgi:hypothetical protein
MQQLFTRANESLYSDLEHYARALRRIVAALPEAIGLCEQVLREVRLVQALLAFGSGPQFVELGQIAFHLSDLWPFRERGPARTAGFSDEIAQTVAHCEQVRRALQILKQPAEAVIAGELRVCFEHILVYLEEQRQLLEECHTQIRPFSTNSDLTRKRLNLLIAAAEARLPASEERRQALATYGAAAELLRSWEGGVPIDDSGVAILDRCIGLLSQSSELFGILSVPASTGPAS